MTENPEPEPGTRNQEPGTDILLPAVKAVYIRVIALEAAIILGLWLLGRLYS